MTDNTAQSFKDKWERNPDLALSQAVDERSEIFNWILTRNGFDGAESLRKFLQGRRRILDAGCGNGRVTALLRKFSSPERTEIVAMDLVSADVARHNLEHYPKITVLQKDLLQDISDLGRFDFIYCQEVLHHTSDPAQAFLNLSALLEPGGEIAIYVYKKKAPMREYCDDYVRSRIGGLGYEEALETCKQITEFGRALAESKLVVHVPGVDVLGIAAGEYPVQRLIYHFFFKCFWNDEFTFNENAVINYDWYHPQLCSRHTVEEARQWFAEAGLRIVHEHVDFYGITIRGVR